MMMMRLRDRRVVGRKDGSVCLSLALRCRRLLLRVAAATGTTAADRSHPPPRDRSRHPSGATHILPAPSANLPLLRRHHHGDHPS